MRGRRDHVALWLVGVAVVSALIRIVLVSQVHGPWIFLDELSYQRLAQSLGESGQLSLFGKSGLSYSPLYPLVLSPIYALGASAPTAYAAIKIVNSVLMSLAVFPVYKIARFVLPPRPSLLVAGLSAAAPLMYYTALAMSENLAYPLFLVAVWAMLEAIRRPSLRGDALLVLAVLAVSAARFQLIVLYPAVLTAILLVGLFSPARESAARRVGRAYAQHRLLLGVGLVAIVAAGVRAVVHGGILDVAGSYSVVGDAPAPNLWQVLERVVQHLAGLDLAVGVAPFVAALVAATALRGRQARPQTLIFASTATSVTAWLLLETGYFGAVTRAVSGPPRIHERYLFYVVPLFLVALVAVWRLADSSSLSRTYLGAAVVAALLPALIPFRSVVNNTIVADTFGLMVFSKQAGGSIVPLPHVTWTAIAVAALLALLYVLVRRHLVAVAVLVVLVFVVISSTVRHRMIDAAGGATYAGLPRHHDWVDRAVPGDHVILIGGRGARRIALLETAFNNLSIAGVYYTCSRAFGVEFGEQRAFVDRTGNLRTRSGPIIAPYAVVPSAFNLRGRVLARNPRGGLVLVAVPAGRLRVSPGTSFCS